MTTGSKIDDFTVTINTDCGPSQEGTYWSRVWNGADAFDVENVVNGPPGSFEKFAKAVLRSRDGTDTIRAEDIPPSRPTKRAKLASKGEHPYSCTYYSSLNPSLTWKIKNHYPETVYSGTVESCFGGPSVTHLTDNDSYKIVERLKEEINGTDFDATVFLGTSHEVLRMLTKNALKIAAAGRYLKSGNVRAAARALGGIAPKRNTSRFYNKYDARRQFPYKSAEWVASHWLELRYGWEPLFKDIHAGAKFIENQLSAPFSKTYRASVKGSWDSFVQSPFFPQATSVARGQIIAILSEEPSNIAKLGLLDPENLAWELTPFSFVADWFLPIGEYLSARSYASHLRGRFIQTTKVKTVQLGGPINPPGFPYDITGGENYYFKQTSLVRTVGEGIQVPQPDFKSLDKALSYRHTQNAVALVVSIFSPKLRRAVT